MKVLYIPDTVSKYGATNSLKELTKKLGDLKNVDINIAINKNNPLFSEFENMGFSVYDSKHVAFMIGEGRTWWKKIIKKILIPYYYLNYKIRNYISVRILEKKINFSSIDIIHSNINRNDLGAILAERNNIKHILHLREFGEEDYQCFSLRKNYINFMNNHVDKFIAISNAVAECWIKKGILKDKVKVIYNGVESKKFQNHQIKKESDNIRIVMSGFIFTGKGQLQLIQALKKIEKVHQISVDFYGEGEKTYINKIKKEIKNTELEKKVKFLGYKNNINELLPNYDIGVICSKAEGFGRVTIEYMMCGLCVIASNTGANVELIKDGKTGYLYNYGDIDNLTLVLNKIIKNIYNLDTIRKNGYENSITKFSSLVNAENIYVLYEELIGECKK
ncbi:MAG TPA: glycosyltransferase family 4 protein [Clostridia bacterium]|nr:glycosyltransferase family 4 protein [Clostridia bacterium]